MVAGPWSTRQLNGMESAFLASPGPHLDPLSSSSFCSCHTGLLENPSTLLTLCNWPPFWVWGPLLEAACRPGSCLSFKPARVSPPRSGVHMPAALSRPPRSIPSVLHNLSASFSPHHLIAVCREGKALHYRIASCSIFRPEHKAFHSVGAQKGFVGALVSRTP